MSKNDGILKDLFFAIGVATVAVGSAYLIGKMVKSKLNIESESSFGEGCICTGCDDDSSTLDADEANDEDTEIYSSQDSELINEDEI